MATLLKRLSLNYERRGRDDVGTTPGGSRTMASTSSFNDFSLHIGQDVDDAHPTAGVGAAAAASQEGPRGQLNGTAASPFVVGSAPAGGSGFAGLSKSAALKIPRSSVAHLLSQRSMAHSESGSGTPRSSLDLPAASLPSPRTSLGGLPSPLSPMSRGSNSGTDAGAAGGAALEEPPSPRSPRSPITPGGRRRKSQKIDGMDYYEFCELIRSSSL